MAKMGAKQDRAKRARRQFTDEFKAGAVRLVLDEGKTVAQVARDLDLTPSALGGWVKQARANRDGGKSGLTSDERAELARLRKELRVVKLEREVLGKAIVHSTGDRNTTRSTSWRKHVVKHADSKTGTGRERANGTVAAVEGWSDSERHRPGSV